MHIREEELVKAGFTKSTSYELFFLVVSLLSFVNLILLFLPFKGQVNDVIFVVDRVTALLFFADFLRRLFSSSDKKHYFFKQYGWTDLLASIPITSFNIFRIFRVIRFIRAIRVLGYKKMIQLIKNKPADTALYGVFLLILLLLQFGSMGILMVESGDPAANIKTASDALWWVFVSITTVGYGDHFPVSDMGRIIGVITLTIGVGLFGVVTGYLANAFLGSKKD